MSRFSDITIVCTLLINAIALISSKLPDSNQELPEQVPLASVDITDPTFSKAPDSSGTEPAGIRAVIHRLMLLVRAVRRYSCFIAIWNMIFFALLLLVFG